MQLQSGVLLQGGKYRIESVLGQGGFGITYLGWQTGLDRQVAIKEFFMKEYCNRNTDTSHVTIGTEGSRELVGRFRQKFIKEAQTIARLDHPNVVRIYDVFEENGTAYYVMEYVEGGSLQKHISQYGALQETEALHYIRRVASALEYIHEHQMNHLDVKPDNILRRRNAQVVLIDFGLSKRYDDSGQQTSTTPVGISTGYAPIEQYKKGGVSTFSPETDIYSLGATLYKLLTGETPPDAADVFGNGISALPVGVSASTNKALRAAMQPQRGDRPQSVQEFLELLDKTDEKKKPDEETTVIAEKEKKREKPEEKKKSPNKKILSEKIMQFIFTGVPIAILLAVAIWNTIKQGGNSPDTEPATQLTTEPTSGNPVDLGLSVKWAAYNVGASSPEGYGGLYGWADPTGEKRSTNDNDYPSADPPSNISGTQYDIARAKWGGKWRLPTQQEFQELSGKCTWKWEKYKGVSGYTVTGSNGNHIFLPASGYRYGESVDSRGSYGSYWSGSFESDTYAYSLNFDCGSRNPSDYFNRDIGHSVRPVSD